MYKHPFINDETDRVFGELLYSEDLNKYYEIVLNNSLKWAGELLRREIEKRIWNKVPKDSLAELLAFSGLNFIDFEALAKELQKKYYKNLEDTECDA